MKNIKLLNRIMSVFFVTGFSLLSTVQAQWTEGFESYLSGSWPATWVDDANATDHSANYVDNTINAYEGSNCLRLFGDIGACWAALACRTLTVSPPFEVELAIRNGSESLSGCNPDRASLGLRKGTSWSNPSRGFIQFMGDNTIASGGGGVNLGIYDYTIWQML